MRTIIAGSRTAGRLDVLDAMTECPWAQDVRTVISGTAKGADYWGEYWAALFERNVEKYPANWGKYGKAAGPLRNTEMANHADSLVAVWDGESRGTMHMISVATSKGLRVFIWRF